MAARVVDVSLVIAVICMRAATSIFRVQQILLARIDAVLRPLDLTFARFEMLTLLGFSKTGALPLAKASSRLRASSGTWRIPAGETLSYARLAERVGEVGHVDGGRIPHGHTLSRRCSRSHGEITFMNSSCSISFTSE